MIDSSIKSLLSTFTLSTLPIQLLKELYNIEPIFVKSFKYKTLDIVYKISYFSKNKIYLYVFPYNLYILLV
ncbi:hypothetical protein CDQ74_01670 [Campylobacter hyointestinalis subsp. hyointestinalis]|uniref:Uncharacterized protein n=1 Tax=Campylobacter hyointestinalis subsp. hyointestinalis TaxID=91352 RepID=A0A855N8P9_CAMHY|nr:hypothetical protein CHH_0662 [Campylobacter hyointestinalis subsp. hyointestinalis LMG 9260]KEA44291.1 hypothetical protein CR67_05550 [Campylobacter hyointestinalis subsp. hyointestinalis]PPB52563.1 hypothetical protein CDQ68_03600 [Campylobacter hyointestinalis subsp. hyointestinalis]PPB53795.1 hypothetical protein CDQ69_05560 [Campylobacter hyointestinalis subsp. hyointestinalis]PPB59254.1 hypothetical protein CDQ71_02885 [Campylobacter hyointestinalis subsp. hyointestinalis]